MKEKELLQLKEKVDKAEQSVQQAKGERKGFLLRMKEDFDCETTKEVKAKRKELESERDQIKSKLEKKIAEIEKKYNGTD